MLNKILIRWFWVDVSTKAQMNPLPHEKNIPQMFKFYFSSQTTNQAYTYTSDLAILLGQTISRFHLGGTSSMFHVFQDVKLEKIDLH